MNLKEFEAIDDLQCDGLRIIQSTKGFRFGTDSVLLANFANPPKGGVVVDFCSGSGVVAILMTAKTRAKSIVALEIMPSIADMLRRSVELNCLERVIDVHCMDVQNAVELLGAGSVDYVTVNPPYTKEGGGIVNGEELKCVARHEGTATLDGICRSAAKILKFGGKLAMVHKVERLADIFCAMRQCKIQPKRMSLFAPPRNHSPKLVLVEGALGGKPGINCQIICQK